MCNLSNDYFQSLALSRWNLTEGNPYPTLSVHSLRSAFSFLADFAENFEVTHNTPVLIFRRIGHERIDQKQVSRGSSGGTRNVRPSWSNFFSNLCIFGTKLPK